MSEFADPFRLRVQKALATALAAITTSGENPYKHEIGADRVFRGRLYFGDNDPLPMLSILEPPLPIEQLPSPIASQHSKGDWDILIQGWVAEDRVNPTDPAHVLLADVKRRLAEEKARVVAGTRSMPNPLGLGENQNGVGNMVTDMIIGPGVVRPPEAGMSLQAFFWLTLTLKISEDNGKPFL